MLSHLFPEVSEWTRQHSDARTFETFMEYRYAVDYHFDQAERASNDCSMSLWGFDWYLDVDGSNVHVRANAFDALIRRGDVAIREAVSAIEAGLQLVNYLLDLGVISKHIDWGIKDKLRKALLARFGEHGHRLEQVLDSVFGSKGYELLSGYRNWVTHRGAPRVVVPEFVAERFLIPEDAFADKPDPEEIGDEMSWRRRRIRRYLTTTIPNQVEVVCWPFVSPVQSVFNATIDATDGDVEPIPGVLIHKGAMGNTFRDVRVVSGSLTEAPGAFEARNNLSLAKRTIMIAGEELAVYSAIDYVQAVSSVVRVVEKSMTNEGHWDSELTRLCRVDGVNSATD